jgi:protein TonB
MHDAVSAVLGTRAQGPGGFRGMMIASSVAHAALVAVLAVGSAGWLTRAPGEDRTVMTISLGGAPGPRAGGLTSMGGRPVQQVNEQPPPPREVPRAPATAPPPMTLPVEKPRPAPKPQTERPKNAAPESASRKPLEGPKVQPGNAVAQTGGRGLGFGLATGGGGTGGEINLADFCCPDYLATLLDNIRANWISKQQVAGMTTVRFTIRRDGSVTDVQLARSSGFAVLDLTAQRAIMQARFPPLPTAYPNPQLTIHLNFEYQR